MTTQALDAEGVAADHQCLRETASLWIGLRRATRDVWPDLEAGLDDPR